MGLSHPTLIKRVKHINLPSNGKSSTSKKANESPKFKKQHDPQKLTILKGSKKGETRQQSQNELIKRSHQNISREKKISGRTPRWSHTYPQKWDEQMPQEHNWDTFVKPRASVNFVQHQGIPVKISIGMKEYFSQQTKKY